MNDIELQEFFNTADEDGEYHEMEKLKFLLNKFDEAKTDEEKEVIYDNICQFFGYCLMVGVKAYTAVMSDSLTEKDIKYLKDGKLDKVKNDYTVVELENNETKSVYVPMFTSLGEDSISNKDLNVYPALADIGGLFDYILERDNIQGIIINLNTSALHIERESIQMIIDAVTIANEEAFN